MLLALMGNIARKNKTNKNHTDFGMNLLCLRTSQIKDFAYSTPSHERKNMYIILKCEDIDRRGVPINPVNEHAQGVYIYQNISEKGFTVKKLKLLIIN